MKVTTKPAKSFRFSSLRDFEGLNLWLMGIIFPFLLFACNPTKQAARKDAKAVDRVLAKRPLLDTVGREWAKLHPCETDSIVTHSTDTLTNMDTVVQISVQKDTVYKTTVVTKTVHIKDTVRVKVTAFRELQIEQENHAKTWGFLIAAQGEIGRLQGKVIQAQDNEKEALKGKSLFKWLFYGLLVALGLGVVLKLKKKI